MHRALRMAAWAMIVLCFGSVALGAAPLAEVEPNDAVPQAIGEVGDTAATIVVRGAADYAGDLDAYAFTLGGGEARSLRLSVEGEGIWQLVLFRDDGVFVASGETTLYILTEPGAYRLRVQNAGLAVGSYTLQITGALERESNDGLVEATVVRWTDEGPFSVHAAIDPAGDVDFFAFAVPTAWGAPLQTLSRIVRIETTAVIDADSVLVLYALDSDLGYLVPVQRDDDSGGEAWSRIHLLNPAPGPYAVRVHEYADNEGIAEYELRFVPMVLRDVEPNDTATEAVDLGTLPAGETITVHQFLAPGDVDAFAFTLAQETCVRVSTAGPAGGGSVVCLADEAGNELGCRDLSNEELWSGLQRRLTAGNYVVFVSGGQPEATFDYTLTVEPGSCPAALDEVEPNDDEETAMALTLPCEVLAEVSPTDLDGFSFTLDHAATLLLETSGDGDGDTYMCLYDEDGATVGCDDDSGDGLWSKLVVDLEPGTYWITVELYAGDTTVSYVLSVEEE
ncbi:MAG: hypothetical protein AB1778_00200 [Candidatus Bipolaricaulota bacterium]